MSFDLEIFNSQVYTAATEIVDQQVEKFNAASGGTIVLSPSGSNVGDYAIKASFGLISGLTRRRDVANGTTSVDAVRLQQLKNASVKVAAGTPPVLFERAQFQWVKQNPALAAGTIGTQLAKAMLQDQLNTAIRSATAAISGVSAVKHDISGEATDNLASFKALAKAAGKFGDRMGDIKAWVIHSKAMTDLYVNALTNAEKLFSYGTINVVRDPFGRIFVITDAAPLTATASSTTKYSTLGLVESAVMVQPNGDFDAVMVDTTGKENIQTAYQAEWSYNVGVLGYTWDVTNGGAAPTDTALGTSSNWDKTATSVKDTAGVALISL